MSGKSALRARESGTDARLAEQETRDRQVAEASGMSYEQFRDLPRQVQGMVVRAWSQAHAGNDSTRPGWASGATDAITAGDAGAMDVRGTISIDQLDRLIRSRPVIDEKTHVYMWRRPILMEFPDGEMRLAHPDFQEIPHKEAPRKEAEGWSYHPYAELPPEGSFPCIIKGANGPCEFAPAVKQEDADIHMEFWHPTEYKALERRRQMQKEDARRDEEHRRADVLERLLFHMAPAEIKQKMAEAEAEPDDLDL